MRERKCSLSFRDCAPRDVRSLLAGSLVCSRSSSWREPHSASCSAPIQLPTRATAIRSAQKAQESAVGAQLLARTELVRNSVKAPTSRRGCALLPVPAVFARECTQSLQEVRTYGDRLGDKIGKASECTAGRVERMSPALEQLAV